MCGLVKEFHFVFFFPKKLELKKQILISEDLKEKVTKQIYLGKRTSRLNQRETFSWTNMHPSENHLLKKKQKQAYMFLITRQISLKLQKNAWNWFYWT